MASITEWRWHRKESVNLKITTKITQFEQSKKHRVGKRMNSTSKMSGTKPKDLVFATGGQKKRRKKIQCSKIHLIKRTEKFSSLAKNINLQIQEDRINPKKLMPKYIIIKLMKMEEKKIFKAARKKMTRYLQGEQQFQMTGKFLSGFMKGRIKWDNLRC